MVVKVSLRVEKHSLWAIIFQVFLTIEGKTMAKPFDIAIIMPIGQVRICGRVRPPGPTPSAPKQWKSDVHVRDKTLSARDCHRRNIKARVTQQRVSAVTGSVPRKMAEGSREVQHHARLDSLEPISPDSLLPALTTIIII